MLAQLLGSRVRAKLLGRLFAHPNERYFVRQLTGLVGEDSTNVSRELARLQELGVLLSQTEGRQKYYQANSQCPVFAELHGLALKTVGLADVLRDALTPLSGKIKTAFVYGSMASGEAGPKSDVDLMVIGDVDEMRLHKALSKTEEALGRAVNYTLMGLREFHRRRKEKNGFFARVLRGPKIAILGCCDEIR